MDRKIADNAQRAQALDPARSFIVQAPAGSGKTGLLIQRILTLLACVEEPEEIIAITFTRKAASEIRERIMSALNEACNSGEPEQEYHRLTWLLAKNVISRNKKCAWGLLENPGRLRIQTIDSLCSMLSRQMPLLSGFGSTPPVTEDADELYKEAARNTIAILESDTHWSESIEHLAGHLDNRLEYLQSLICNMLSKRDQWLRHVADPAHPAIDRVNLESALGSLVEDRLLDLSARWPKELNEQISSLMVFAQDNLVTAGIEGEFVSASFTGFPGDKLEDLKSWRFIADFLLTGEGALRKKVDKRQGFPPASAGRTADEKKLFPQMKEDMVKLLACLGSFPDAIECLHTIRVLPCPEYSEDEWQTMQALFEILRLSAAQLEMVFYEKDSVDFTAISLAATRALGEPENPTDLAMALDYKINHLLIDEFQDTSMSQFELIRQLTSGWTGDDHRTLFIVGDPMQSIYRFREAEVGLFLEAWNEGIGDITLIPVQLKVNFRSQAGIIEWVNSSFRKILPARDDLESGAVRYVDSMARHDAIEGNACTVYPCFIKDEEQEARKILLIIQQTKKTSPDGTIAILVRGRSHLSSIINSLIKAKLKYRAVEIEGLSHRPVIQDLLSLVKAMIQLSDRIAWLAVLRAPWCGLKLSDLYALCSLDREKNVLELVVDSSHQATISQDGQSRLQRVCGVLQASINSSQRQGLRQWVEGAWLSLGGPACLSDETDIEDAEVFFQLLEKINSLPQSKVLYELQKSVNRLFALPDIHADENLQVMTIHKSKGLEFDTVILPGLGNKTAGNDSHLIKWFERPRKPDASDLLMAPIRKTGEDINQKYKLLEDFEKKKEFYESGRLLYVAATRARRRLHIFGHVQCNIRDGVLQPGKPRSGSLLASLWPAVQDIYDNEFESCKDRYLTDGGEPDRKQTGSGNRISRLAPDWRLPDAPCSYEYMGAGNEQPGESLDFDWAGDTARFIGIVAHEIIQYISNENISSYDTDLEDYFSRLAGKSLSCLGVPASELGQSVVKVIDSVRNTMKDTRGRWILNPVHREARNEYALTGRSGSGVEHIIIDRTFVDENNIRWIIDYKTGSHSGTGKEVFMDREMERYRGQLENYAMIMSKIDKRDIKLGLYFPMLQGWREWEYKK